MPRAAVFRKGVGPHPSVHLLFTSRLGRGRGRVHGRRAPSHLWPVPAGSGPGPPVAGAEELSLRPRPLALLRYLVEHPGRLVTKAEMRQHVWGGTHVSDVVLRVCVQEIRVALGDAVAAPRYLATVGRQGYRFVGGDDQERPHWWHRAHRARSLGARPKLRSWKGGSSRRPTGPASSSFSVATLGWARRRWSRCGSPARELGVRRGWRGASASSTMGRGNRTCPSWRHWGSSAVALGPRRCWRWCGSMPRCGSPNCPGW